MFSKFSSHLPSAELFCVWSCCVGGTEEQSPVDRARQPSALQTEEEEEEEGEKRERRASVK